MIDIIAFEDDDPAFLALIGSVVRGALLVYQPRELYVVKVDNWFDHKWLGWSGMDFGPGGPLSEEFTLSAFTPNRIRSQHHFVWNAQAADYICDGTSSALHVHQQTSQTNLGNFGREVAKRSPS